MSRIGSLLRFTPSPVLFTVTSPSGSANSRTLHECSSHDFDCGISLGQVARRCYSAKAAIHFLAETRMREKRLLEDVSPSGLLAGRSSPEGRKTTWHSAFRARPSVQAHTKRTKTTSFMGLIRSFSTAVPKDGSDAELRSENPGSVKHSSNTVELPFQLQSTSLASSRFIPTKEAFHYLVNTYPEFPNTRQSRRPTRQKRDHYPLAPRLVLLQSGDSDNVGSTVRHSQDGFDELDPDTRKTVEQIRELLSKPVGHISLIKIWSLYSDLSTPRPRHFTLQDLHRFFRQLAWVEYKHEENARHRFMTLLHDCRACKIEIDSHIWNTAISYAARQSQYVTRAHIQEAVELWQDMESAGHEATHVTFNILYDAAVRAGLFGLADTLHTELIRRNMPLNRYFRTVAIFHAGRRKDGDAVRASFRDLVDAGEIVDTAVMNCVIWSLVRCGEGEAAENVLSRMKSLVAARQQVEAEIGDGPAIARDAQRESRSDGPLDAKTATIGPQTWQGRKKLGNVLSATAEKLRREKIAFQKSFFGTPFSTADQREQVQARAPLAPDARTYRTLIRWHVEETGDWPRAKALLGEMKQLGMHVYGGVYRRMFRGFGVWGGYARSEWSLRELELIWKEFVSAVKSDSSKSASHGAEMVGKGVIGCGGQNANEGAIAKHMTGEGNMDSPSCDALSSFPGASSHFRRNSTSGDFRIVAEPDAIISGNDLEQFLPLADISVPDNSHSKSKLQTNNGQAFSVLETSGDGERHASVSEGGKLAAGGDGLVLGDSSRDRTRSSAIGAGPYSPTTGLLSSANSPTAIASGPSIEASNSSAPSSKSSPGSQLARLCHSPDVDDQEDDAVLISETDRTPYIGPSLTQLVLDAFLTCAGSKRMAEIQAELLALEAERSR